MGSSCKFENKRFLLFLYKPPAGVAASSFVVSFCFVLLGFVLFFFSALDADDDDAVAVKYLSTSQEEDTQSVDNSQFRRARPREKHTHMGVPGFHLGESSGLMMNCKICMA